MTLRAPSPSALAMLAIANAAMRDLSQDVAEAVGCSSLDGLALHRRRARALFAPGGPVEMFNARAAITGTDPVTMISTSWQAIHADAVARMVAAASAAILPDGTIPAAA